MYCATCSMGEYKMNPPLLMPALSLYVGQCIGMDTVRIQMDNAQRRETRGLEAGRGATTSS